MPIPWVKVHDLPDYVYFNHSAHVTRGIGCVSCHGRIDKMEVVSQDQPLTMGWCLDCHRQPEKFLRPVEDVTRMDWTAGEDQLELGRRLRTERQHQPFDGLCDMSPIDRADRYWRSLDEKADTPEFRAMLAREYPSEPWESLPPSTRRQFLKVMGASLALAGLAGCRCPREKIVPFARPAGYTPGVPLQYATAMELGGVASGLLVTSYDGRPIKIEGNPEHPMNLGAADAITQASILGLYDPARSRAVIRRQGGQKLAPGWAGFLDFAREQFGALRGSGRPGLAHPERGELLAEPRCPAGRACQTAILARRGTSTSRSPGTTSGTGRPWPSAGRCARTSPSKRPT